MEGGPPRFPQGSSSPTVLRSLPREAHTHAVYGTFTLCGRPSQMRSTTRRVSQLRVTPCRVARQVLQHRLHNAARLSRALGLGSSPFARRYLGNLGLISSPPGTEMVQFPGFPFRYLWIQSRMTDIPARRVTPFGHPRIPGCVLLPAASRSLPRPSSYSGS